MELGNGIAQGSDRVDCCLGKQSVFGERKSSRAHKEYWTTFACLLCFELIGQDEVGVTKKISVGWYDCLIDV